MAVEDGRTPGQWRSDAEWGRQRGAVPPLSQRAPLLWWLTTSVLLSVVVIVVVGGPGPLDDPSQGDQRPGILLDPDEAPVVGGLEFPGDPVGRQPVFVAFDRSVPPPAELRKVLDAVPRGLAFVLAVPAAEPAVQRELPGRVGVIADPGGMVARAVQIARPKDGAYPIGYALIDGGARARYATLDPGWTGHLDEVATVAGAVR